MRIVSGYYEGDTSCPYQNPFAEGFPEPLLKQSRDLRLRALEVMPEFLERITSTVHEKVQNLEDVKNKLSLDSPQELRL